MFYYVLLLKAAYKIQKTLRAQTTSPQLIGRLYHNCLLLCHKYGEMIKTNENVSLSHRSSICTYWLVTSRTSLLFFKCAESSQYYFTCIQSFGSILCTRAFFPKFIKLQGFCEQLLKCVGLLFDWSIILKRTLELRAKNCLTSQNIFAFWRRPSLIYYKRVNMWAVRCLSKEDIYWK